MWTCMHDLRRCKSEIGISAYSTSLIQLMDEQTFQIPSERSEIKTRIMTIPSLHVCTLNEWFCVVFIHMYVRKCSPHFPVIHMPQESEKNCIHINVPVRRAANSRTIREVCNYAENRWSINYSHNIKIKYLLLVLHVFPIFFLHSFLVHFIIWS